MPKIALLVPLYGNFSPRWLTGFLVLQHKITEETGSCPMVFTEGAYVDQSFNALIVQALPLEVEWFLLLESDNIIPPSFVSRILSLDPVTHSIVSSIYHGRVQDDQRPTSGYLDADGVLHRLTYPAVKAMYEHPGLHSVHVVPTGATAIHRTVFENWPRDGQGSWFRNTSERGRHVGHDVNFCIAARAQGLGIWLDTENVTAHLGEWVSTDQTYLATNAHIEATRGVTIDGNPAA